MCFKSNARLIPQTGGPFSSGAERGFTFIEILIALALIGILFVPIMQLFTYSLKQTQESMDTITAVSLAKSYMERTMNLNLTKNQLKERGDEIFPPLEEPAILMNQSSWRVKRDIQEKTDPLEIRIVVMRAEAMDAPVVTLTTLKEDLAWDSIRSVTPDATGGKV